MSCQDIFFLNSFLYTNLVRIYCFRMDEVIWPFKSKQDAPTMQEHSLKILFPYIIFLKFNQLLVLIVPALLPF